MDNFELGKNVRNQVYVRILNQTRTKVCNHFNNKVDNMIWDQTHNQCVFIRERIRVLIDGCVWNKINYNLNNLE